MLCRGEPSFASFTASHPLLPSLRQAVLPVGNANPEPLFLMLPFQLLEDLFRLSACNILCPTFFVLNPFDLAAIFFHEGHINLVVPALPQSAGNGQIKHVFWVPQAATLWAGAALHAFASAELALRRNNDLLSWLYGEMAELSLYGCDPLPLLRKF